MNECRSIDEDFWYIDPLLQTCYSDPMPGLIETVVAFGYIGIFLTIFVESGILVGFFLPGDSLLFTVGLLASQGYFNISLLVTLVVIAAILGDNVGYWLGWKFGPKVFSRKDSLFFKREYVTRAEEFYAKHGKKAIIMARFIPVIRTLIPIMAGVGSMRYHTFLVYNIIGAAIWGAGVTLLAYFLGSQFPWVEKYLEYIIVAIILTSFLPIIIDLTKAKLRRRDKLDNIAK